MSYFLLVISILLGALGQVGLKYSTTVEPRLFIGVKTINEYFFLSLIIYFVSVIFYTLSLRDLALNIAYPSVATSYVLVAYLSHTIWGTSFGVREVIALSLIMIAISILVMGK